MSDLFSTDTAQHEPLAARMRPKSLDEFIGQDHILGPGRLLRRAIVADQLTSLIFFGPPGTGKTTLAHVIAHMTHARFFSLNAVLAGLKDLRDVIDQAQEQKRLYQRKSILFVDEVHRWNKSQQDALLPWTENGTIILIGATTENPYFRVNQALISRSRIFQLKSLSDEDLHKAALAAISDPARGYGQYKVRFDEQALKHLVRTASGDCRNLFNALELAVETTPEQFPPPHNEEIHITIAIAEESIQKKVVLYDQEGDYHYDSISAFIKSVRGSDPDAALYWLAHMISAGEDPSFIWRRLLILASEDIGLADPHAIAVVTACMDSFERIGLPEGNYPLAHATLYLATTEKSNSTMAFFDAMKLVQSGPKIDVPNHLCDNNRDAKGLGHGQGYHYPHAFTDHWVAQQYLPTALQGQLFYQPTDQGYEGRIRERILKHRELQLGVEHEESVTKATTVLSAADQHLKETWLKRLEVDYAGMQQIRSVVFDALDLPEYACVYIYGQQSGYLIFEALRRLASANIYANVHHQASKDKFLFQAQNWDTMLQPSIAVGGFLENTQDFPDQYEAMILSRPSETMSDLMPQIMTHLKEKGLLIVILPAQITSLAQVFANNLTQELQDMLKDAEQVLAQGLAYHECEHALKQAGLSVKVEEISTLEKRDIEPRHIEHWLSDTSELGRILRTQARTQIISCLKSAHMPIQWPRHYKIFIARREGKN